MSYLTANPNPTSFNKRAYKQGWNDALKVLNSERQPYKEPERNTWMAIGYRHGLQNRTDDPATMDRAWEWSLGELRRVGSVDETKFTG